MTNKIDFSYSAFLGIFLQVYSVSDNKDRMSLSRTLYTCTNEHQPNSCSEQTYYSFHFRVGQNKNNFRALEYEFKKMLPLQRTSPCWDDHQLGAEL